MAKSVYVLTFSCIDVNENEPQILIINPKRSNSQLFKLIKEKLKEFFIDLYDEEEFEEYWENSDFKNAFNLEEDGWFDCNYNPFICKLQEVL